jgi:hypothetical protein
MPYRKSIVCLLAVPTFVLLGACSDDEKATPQVIFDGKLTIPTAQSATTCTETGPYFHIGTFANNEAGVASAPIPDGTAYSTGTVSVACSVVSNGAGGFTVNASADLTGSAGGLFRIDGVFTATGVQNNIHAYFSSRQNGTVYEETDRKCTVDYTGPQGVAAGRVWGRLVCPNAVYTEGQKACQAEANFRFENCAQN